MSELEYDKNFAAWLTAAGITPPSDPINLRSVVHQILLNIGSGGSGVTSFNTRTGVVTLTVTDVEKVFTAAGQILSGTGTNTGQLIDLLSAIEAKFTAAGQLIVGTGSGTGELLGGGTTGQVLTAATGAAPSWAAVSSAGIPQGRAQYGAGPTILLSQPGAINGAGVTTYTASINRAAYFPMYLTTAVTVSQIVVETTTGQASSHAQLAIYGATDNWQPNGSAAVISTGAISTAGTGVISTAVGPTVLQPGLYLKWMNVDTASIIFRSTSLNVGSVLGYVATLGANPYIVQTYTAQTYGAPPNPGLAWDTVATGAALGGFTDPVFLQISVA